MESEISIASSNSSTENCDTREEEVAFQGNWQATDAALLQPHNLAIPKLQRAWDRKPLPAFTKARSRFGKVWKRSTPLLQTARQQDAAIENRATKRRKARTSLQGPLKPVKKMCLESGFGLAPRVAVWEGVESPVRKIVTRSNAAAEDIIALPDEIEEMGGDLEEAADVTIEILDDDGMVLEIDPEDAGETQGWEDEEQDSELSEETVLKDTTVPVANGVGDTQQETDTETVADLSVELSGTEDSATAMPTGADPTGEEHDTDERAVVVQTTDEVRTALSAATLATGSAPLPDGFVSPAKRSAVASRRQSGVNRSSGRRRTLPVQFAPIPALEPSVEVFNQVASMVPNPFETKKDIEAAREAARAIAAEETQQKAENIEFEHDSHEWEDIEGNVLPSETLEPAQTTLDVPESGDDEMMQSLPDIQEDSALPGTPSEQPTSSTEIPQDVTLPQVESLQSSEATQLPSSAVPSIEGQHPRLPLRRSPRRKSSSPLKQRSVSLSTEKPHLVAFTPIKGPATYPSPSNHPGSTSPIPEEEDTHAVPSSPIERAASAPPESPQMSPQKPSKPRVSDDIGLLQAFLNRAAESKSSKRSSTSKRESITNRRDSGAIRNALASPAKADVLADLDPNSPSPRKTSAPQGLLSAACDQVVMKLASDSGNEEQRAEEEHEGKTRRSGRATAKSAQTGGIAPNKISIRGNAEGVVLKRSEAQELATLTRNNTRKNKGGAVLPPVRLTKLTSQTGLVDPEAGAEDEEQGRAPGGKGVKWSETLVEFYQGGDGLELSVLSDDSNAAPARVEQTDKAEDDATPAANPPPPAETPSKPKIRRLKPPRTAATPGKAAAAPPPPAGNDTSAPESKDTQPKQSATKRRSRIATPAKGLTDASLLPADLDPEPASAIPKKSVALTKKKAPASKLPAPASSSAPLNQGKENTLISSPPKKKAPAPAAASLPSLKTFAPKLDFGKTARLEPAGLGDSTASVPGLASPAKKGGRTRSVFHYGSTAGDMGTSASEVAPALAGLSSPAKKRTKRAF